MNKYPYIGWTEDDPTPRHIVGGPLTGWILSDANRQIKCSKCGSDPGYLCETPKGKKARYAHDERVSEWMATQQQDMLGTVIRNDIMTIIHNREENKT